MIKEKQKISDKIEEITAKCSQEYEELAQISEKLYDEKIALEKRYQDFDAKTGLSNLYTEFARLSQK